MTVSDTLSLVLRKTSLTMRERFTPARSCSTFTRICANIHKLWNDYHNFRPAIKKGLFFGIFRPLTPPFGGVDDQPGRFPGSALGLGKVRGVPLGEDSQVVQGRAQDRQQPMNPIIYLGRTQAKEFAHDCLKRIGLEVEQKKQELILRLL